LPGAMQKYALANQLQMYQEISFTASSNIFWCYVFNYYIWLPVQGKFKLIQGKHVSSSVPLWIILLDDFH
jgi:hypothetical protein